MRNATMLYKAPGNEPIHGSFLATLIVDADEEGELEAAIADGWFLTTPEAIAAYEEAKAAEEAKLAPQPFSGVEAAPAANVGNWQTPAAVKAPAAKAKK